MAAYARCFCLCCFPRGDFWGERSKFGVDVTPPCACHLVVYPHRPVLIRAFARGTHQEELMALRDRVEVVEAERDTLHATVRTMGAVKTSLRNRMKDERQTRIKIERQLA
ncbi:hypothetical protein Tco_1099432 [Tanacetum coccineum]